MFLRRAEHGAVQRNPPQIQVQVMLPGDTDTTVHLHAGLHQPAGHLEDGEALLDAVIRETLEETAWQFTPEALLGVYQWRSARGHTTLRFAFTGSVRAYDADRRLDPPIVTTHWLAREDIAQRAARLRTPLVLRCVEDYLAGRRLPLDALAAESDDPKLSW